MSFLAELKRRNVIRMAGLYLVGAWLIVQVAGTVLPMFEVPSWVARAVVIILALGFVPALVFAWVFELTPQGLQRDVEVEVDPQHAVRAQTWRRMDRLIVVALLIVIGSMAVERFWIAEKSTGGVKQAEKRGAVSAAGKTPLIPTAPSQTFSPPRGSLAVLSFANMSPDPENEYFADGIAEELLNVLARVEGLKVASRTSAFSFKGQQVPVREIAQQLNVAHVLEGSVRKQGGKVRITAQLIDAATDQHLWSDTFDRDLTDIFAVQQEIAQSISAALSGALGLAGQSRKVEVDAATQDLQAYELYLRGRQLFYQRGEALLAARKVLEEAVRRDPEFAEAWAVLSGVHWVSADYVDTPVAQATAAALAAAGRALELDASLSLPYAVQAQVRHSRGDLIGSERLYSEAIRHDPRDSTVLLWRGMFYLGVGDLAKSESDLRRAFEIDPMAGITLGWLATVQGLRGNREEAAKGLQPHPTSAGHSQTGCTRDSRWTTTTAAVRFAICGPTSSESPSRRRARASSSMRCMPRSRTPRKAQNSTRRSLRTAPVSMAKAGVDHWRHSECTAKPSPSSSTKLCQLAVTIFTYGSARRAAC